MSNLAAMYQHQQATSPAKQPAKEKEPGKSLEWYRHHSQEGKVGMGTSIDVCLHYTICIIYTIYTICNIYTICTICTIYTIYTIHTIHTI